MSPNLIKAVISVEDQRFYEHGGVDGIRVIGGGVKNLRDRDAARKGAAPSPSSSRARVSSPATRPTGGS